MKIGVPAEIKKHEYRVGLTPANVREYVRHGHQVTIQSQAGIGAGFSDTDYELAGATITTNKQSLFDEAELIIKVKEPQPEEYGLFHPNQILYTYLHLAADEELTKSLMAHDVSAIAYETMQSANGALPCLTPMSEIAGRLSVQEGAKYLEKPFGGRGVLLGGVPGVPRGKVAVIGGGVVGTNAIKMAVGLGAEVTVLDINARQLAYLDDIFSSRITTLYSNRENIEMVLAQSDLIIGAVLIPGARAPHLVKREDLKLMKPGAVIVDVAVDQGGCFETTHPTTHDDPVYTIDDVVHYGVANMPGSVALTSTLALTGATLPHGLLLADLGLEKALEQSELLKTGLNTHQGKCIHPAVAKTFGF